MPERPMLHLASASPRRRDILAGLGLSFSWSGAAVDEARADDEPPDAMVVRLAAAKAAAAENVSPALVLGADTAVALEGRVFGKPADREEGAAMLAALSGRTHEVLTGIALLAGDRQRIALSRTRVTFRDIGPDEAGRYWQTGEPADKAGGYAIQGLGALFVAGIRGSYTGVVGLPVFETAMLLAEEGLFVLSATAYRAGTGRAPGQRHE